MLRFGIVLPKGYFTIIPPANPKSSLWDALVHETSDYQRKFFLAKLGAGMLTVVDV